MPIYYMYWGSKLVLTNSKDEGLHCYWETEVLS